MQLATFDLNLLRTLDALLRERSVTRAAEQLNVTQQAMSGSLKRLREQFGDELLVQVGRRFELTPLGAALSGPVHEVMLHILRVVKTKPRFDAEQSTHRFRIGMSDFAALTILPPLMAELSRRAPDVVCDIKPIGENVFDDLALGTLDFCLLPSNWRIYQENLPDGIRSSFLFEDDFVCVFDAENPVGDVLTVEDYMSMPHNTVRLGGDVRTIVENAWTLNRLVPKIAATSSSFTSLLAMVVGTPMVATVQRSLAAKLAASFPIRILECPIPIDTMVQNLSWHQRNEQDPAHIFMRECFANAATTLG